MKNWLLNVLKQTKENVWAFTKAVLMIALILFGLGLLILFPAACFVAFGIWGLTIWLGGITSSIERSGWSEQRKREYEQYERMTKGK